MLGFTLFGMFSLFVLSQFVFGQLLYWGTTHILLRQAKSNKKGCFVMELELQWKNTTSAKNTNRAIQREELYKKLDLTLKSKDVLEGPSPKSGVGP